MKTIDDLTIGQARELAAIFPGTNLPAVHPFKIGQNYIIRTVTMTLTGRLIAVHPTELVLVDVAWIADSGRWNVAVSKGEFNEVETWPDGVEVIVGRGALIDASVLTGNLPRSIK